MTLPCGPGVKTPCSQCWGPALGQCSRAEVSTPPQCRGVGWLCWGHLPPQGHTALAGPDPTDTSTSSSVCGLGSTASLPSCSLPLSGAPKCPHRHPPPVPLPSSAWGHLLAFPSSLAAPQPLLWLSPPDTSDLCGADLQTPAVLQRGCITACRQGRTHSSPGPLANCVRGASLRLLHRHPRAEQEPSAALSSSPPAPQGPHLCRLPPTLTSSVPGGDF